jgi:hypothetical protein
MVDARKRQTRQSHHHLSGLSPCYGGERIAAETSCSVFEIGPASNSNRFRESA